MELLFIIKTLYHIGVIYSAYGKTEAETYLKEAREASFELGPQLTHKIDNQIANL
ncbi:hypothetical protein SAMN04488028_101460 [Reichenbachiella agariperforans]|uniref:Uncharacterized protein n=1 Tax=Reichenbachiella agariperforans TaxID=156994 RepID=A0A1M6K6N8_REIAG|nr:hypothetical protein SAMN04488028_101460 [Reichenbachiella agariperforans]